MAILPSNVGRTEEPPPPKKGSSMLVVGGMLLVAGMLVGGAIVFLFVSSQPRPQAAAKPVLPPATATARPPVAAGGVQAPMPRVNGISCDALEYTVFHIHVHLAIFVDGREQLVPYGIGIGEPWQLTNSSQGPFVADGSCFYWLHTHTENGVVHIESPVRRSFTLGDVFAIWQELLSPTQVGRAQGTVIMYVDGERSTTSPAELTLASHQLIQLNVGRDVPPQPFEFAPGD